MPPAPDTRSATRTRPWLRISGTAAIVIGTAISAISVYLFQVISGRTLGPEQFAPIGVLWTVSFIVFTVLMLPVEQFVTRRLVLARGAGQSLHGDRRILTTTLSAGVLIGGAFVLITLDRFFEGAVMWVAATIALLGVRSVYSLARGFLAGRRRFHAYGGTVGLEGVTLAGVAVVVAVLRPTSLAFAIAMVVAPVGVLLFKPFRRVEAPAGDLVKEERSAGHFLGFYLLATASSQIIIAGGPIVVGLIGGTAAAVSIYFITFTLFRGPVTSSYNLLARVLPDFTDLAARGDEHRLGVWSLRLGALGLGLAALGFVAGYVLGRWVITLLYGSEFAPPAMAAALGAAAVGAAIVALFSGQIFVARGRTDLMALVWLAALLLSALTIVLSSGDPITRVSLAYAVGEVSALIGLSVVGRFSHGRAPAKAAPRLWSPLQ